MAKPFSVRWGIMATGGIAQTFTKDLLISPATRDVHDIIHQVTAVASSSSIKSAEKFISQWVSPAQSPESVHCTPYASYEELVNAKDVDIIYIATPHSHHFQNCMLALHADKSILCEKPFTVNAGQARLLYQTAKDKKLFLMEAVWTRYFPLSIAIRNHIKAGDIGEVLRVSADLSVGQAPEDAFPVTHRMINMDLAGGCLLDLGIYSLTWIFQTLYHTLPKELRQRPVVRGVAMTPEPRTGADEMTTILLEFPKSSPTGLTKAHAVATTALRVDQDPDEKQSAGPAVRIQGTHGEIQVYGPIFRPHRYTLIPRNKADEKGDSEAGDEKGGKKKEVLDRHFDFPGGGHGMFWEADEAGRCVRDGKLESDGMDWEESLAVMDVLDKTREIGGLAYPDEIETTRWPVDMKAKAK